MQPDPEKNEWQQPPQQPSQAPYAVPSVEAPAQQPTPAPVVSLTPDQPPVPTPAAPTEVSEPEAAPVEDLVTDPSTDAPAPTQPTPTQPEDQPVHWQANEYIHHEKSPVWFVIFAVVVVLLIAAAIFLMQSITFAILVPVMAVALLVYSHRPPRVLNYTLSRQGLHINDHLYPFSQFKGFGVIHDGQEYSVMLLPTKRFQPGVSVYFPEESGEAIVDMLGVRLPMQELHLDAVDKIVRKLRI